MENRHERTMPSEVRRVRSHALQKGSDTEAITPRRFVGSPSTIQRPAGGLDVVLDDGEKHPLYAGDTLAFNGRHYFAADATADTVAIHTTIRE